MLEVFGTGRPDVAVFHAKTSDNPYLPPAFHDNVSRQYTAILRQQELGGLFVDSAGSLFRREWFGIIDRPPTMMSCVRAWDLAASVAELGKDPDWTSGCLMGRAQDGGYVVLDVRRKRGTPSEIQGLVRATAEADGAATTVWMEQEPGSAGIGVIDFYRRHVLPGFSFYGQRSTGSKLDRAQGIAAMAEGQAITLLRGPWNRDFLDEAECFPDSKHDDQVDSLSLAFSKVSEGMDWGDFGMTPLRDESIVGRMLTRMEGIDPDDRRHDDPDDAGDDADDGADQSFFGRIDEMQF